MRLDVSLWPAVHDDLGACRPVTIVVDGDRDCAAVRVGVCVPADGCDAPCWVPPAVFRALPETCETCHGMRSVACRPRLDETGHFVTVKPCPDCVGGVPLVEFVTPCAQCDGLGTMDATEADCEANGILYEPSVHDGQEDCDVCDGEGRVRLARGTVRLEADGVWFWAVLTPQGRTDG